MDKEIKDLKKRKWPKVLLVTLLVAGIISLVTTLSVLLKDDGNFFLLHVFTNTLLTKRFSAHFSLFVVCRRRRCRCELFLIFISFSRTTWQISLNLAQIITGGRRN